METLKMYEFYLKGNSLQKVGIAFGISRQAVYERFLKANLKLRTKESRNFIIIDNIKFTINRDGYYESTTQDRLMLHNYIYERSYGKIPDGYEIHHIDCNKLNNDLTNLQLLTPSEHTKIHAILRNGSGMNKRVKCVETGETFDSISIVAKLNNQHQSNVSRYYIDGKRKLNGYTYEKID
jgi:hypothetical protein